MIVSSLPYKQRIQQLGPYYTSRVRQVMPPKGPRGPHRPQQEVAIRLPHLPKGRSTNTQPNTTNKQQEQQHTHTHTTHHISQGRPRGVLLRQPQEVVHCKGRAASQAARKDPAHPVRRHTQGLRENHLFSTTCLTQVFFKRGEYVCNLW